MKAFVAYWTRWKPDFTAFNQTMASNYSDFLFGAVQLKGEWFVKEGHTQVEMILLERADGQDVITRLWLVGGQCRWCRKTSVLFVW